MDQQKARDIKNMKLAIRLAKMGVGLTGSNPSVGCVIAKDDKILAKSTTGIGGVPHAEVLAIKQAGKNTKGATLYVTLEPCCHTAKTGPCAQEILKSGISRVVISVKDPDKRVNGKGVKFLKKNNIDTALGVCSKQALLANIGYFYRKLNKRPFITLKIATTLDGKIACKNGQSKWITSAAARVFAHKIRLKNDAIMIGSGTLKKDNPYLDCRLKGVQKPPAIKVILDSKGATSDPGLNVFKSGFVWSFGAKNDFCCKNFINFPTCINADGYTSLHHVVYKLAELGISNLLVEGGAKVATQLLKKDLIDKIIWIRSNAIAGDDAIGVFDKLDLQNTEQFYRFDKLNSFDVGNDNVDFFVKKTKILRDLDEFVQRFCI